jgi:hypothetical protein
MMAMNNLGLRAILYLLIAFVFVQCNSDSSSTSNKKEQNTELAPPPKNEVIVLGTIHGKHLKSETYGIDALTKLVREINPDYILTEIPPDRFSTAMEGFKANDSISEPRVMRFPEYVDVIFPLTKELDFEIIPTAGWTKEMSDFRSNRLKEIRKDSSRAADWAEYQIAAAKSDSASSADGIKDDPYWIHSESYDAAVELWASTYNRLFNEELGLGGWDNINKTHYSHIENALNEYQNAGKRFLITYGAGHKGWFLRELKKRDDIVLMDVAPFLEKIGVKKPEPFVPDTTSAKISDVFLELPETFFNNPIFKELKKEKRDSLLIKGKCIVSIAEYKRTDEDFLRKTIVSADEFELKNTNRMLIFRGFEGIGFESSYNFMIQLFKDNKGVDVLAYVQGYGDHCCSWEQKFKLYQKNRKGEWALYYPQQQPNITWEDFCESYAKDEKLKTVWSDKPPFSIQVNNNGDWELWFSADKIDMGYEHGNEFLKKSKFKKGRRVLRWSVKASKFVWVNNE